jgi:tripartite-type tricarboxylate transporter receptor subunit TctC
MNRPPYHEVEKFCPRAQARGRMGVFVVDKKPPLIELAEAFAKYSIIEF